jgi:hypothetical protein
VAEQTGSGERGKVSTLFAIRELALIARDEGDFEQARDILDDALQCLEDLEHANLGPWARSEFRTTRASVELRRDEPDRALEDLTAVLAEPDVPSHIGKVLAVELTAIALAQQGKAEQAARLLGAVDRERERTGLVIRPPDVPLRESALHDIQSILGPDWASSEAQGRTMTLNEAFDYAATESSVDEDALGTTPDAARSADSPG